MEFRVTALVLSHERPEYLRVTLSALAAQSRAPDRVLVVDSSESESAVSVIQESGFESLRLRKLENFNRAFQACFDNQLANSAQVTDLLWFLHDDSAPFPDALELLLASFERSPSVALLGPKQLDWHQPHVIAQQGLTLTPLGRPWPRVSDQLDQSQHDRDSDVLAIGTAGMLLRYEVFQQLEGFSGELVPWAADFDLSIRARRAGHRVIVVPEAKVAHARLGLKGEPQSRWRGGGTAQARRRAEIELRSVHASAALAACYLLLLPLIALLRALWQLLVRRPRQALAELVAATVTLGKLPALIRARARVARTTNLSMRGLASLRASWRELRIAARERRNLAVAPERESDESPGSGFFESGSVWIVPALLALAFPFWIMGQAATGGGLLPIVSSWLELAAAAGGELRYGAFAEAAPADPFHWLLASITAPFFWQPNVALVILIAAALPLGFSSARLALRPVTGQSWARNIAALCYALWPANLQAIAEGRLPAILAHVLLPLTGFLLARAAGLGGRGSARWLALAALSFAALAASSPVLGLTLLLPWLALLIWRFRSAPRLLWWPLPAIALWSPLAAWLFERNLPLWLLLSEPGPVTSSSNPTLLEFPLGGIAWGNPWWLSLALVPVLLLALTAIPFDRSKLATPALLLGALGLALAAALTGFSFPSGPETVAADQVPASLTSASTLFSYAATALLALSLTAIPALAWRRLLAVGLLVLTVSPLAAIAFTSKVSYRASAPLTVPAVVAAERGAGLRANLLWVVDTGGQSLAVSVSSNAGIGLEHQSLSARLVSNGLLGSDLEDTRGQLTEATASLLFGSGKDAALLARQHIAYALVRSDNRDLLAALDANARLEPIGETDFGRLYRLRDFDPAADALTAPQAREIGLVSEPLLPGLAISSEKAVILGILALYVLALLPAPGSRSSQSRERLEEGFVR